MRIHVDGDVIVYRAGFAAEKALYSLVFDGNQEQFTYKKDLEEAISDLGLQEGQYEVVRGRNLEPVGNALHNVKSMIGDVTSNLNSDDVVIHLSGGTNFREGIAVTKPYKGHRDKKHRPEHGPAIKEYMERHWPVIWSDNEEADDTIGYNHYKMWEEDQYSSIVCTTDKDLDMIPGLHYNLTSQSKYYVEPEDADWVFYVQLLTGDSTDNIPGCPGIGAVKAKKVLDRGMSVQDMYEVCLDAYKGDEELLLEQARLIWIRREPDQLWEPPVDEDGEGIRDRTVSE